MDNKCDYLIVGAGLFGCVLAERLANDAKKNVILIDKNNHLGGMCYSEIDPLTGIDIHYYGSHIFNTSNPNTWKYITSFSEINNYKHKVLSEFENNLYPIPINLQTINTFCKTNFTDSQAISHIKKEIKKTKPLSIITLEDKMISLMGLPLYEAFIKNYTIKQWAIHPNSLPFNFIKRLEPIRYDFNENYFNKKCQGIPVNGYNTLFYNMISSKRIKLILNCDFFENINKFKISKKIIYTGPIDKFFNFKSGKLEWRSLNFTIKHLNEKYSQSNSVINFPKLNKIHTRIHEFKYLHPEKNYPENKTIISYEVPVNNPDNPIYPVHSYLNIKLLSKYKKLAKSDKSIIFGGRLGTYSYFNMDETISSALRLYKKIV